jgi:chemotaxis protein histidine kinase CheA
MAQPVWTLSVDLQTKTATFQTGMAEAAQSARGAFKDIQQSSNEMAGGVEEASGRVGYSMTEARHGVMMLGEEFGIHLPRGLTTFIASLGPVGAAMEAAFPFLAIILGATLLIEHLTKLGDAAEKASEAGRALGDDMDKGIIKAKEGMVDAEIEIRKLAGEPAWDLLDQKLKLQDADEGIENVHRLDKALADLLKQNGATTNWNPFNWGDKSDELQNKTKSLQGQMQGKSQTEQNAVLAGELAIQAKVLETMKQQTDVSGAQLKNQAAYVDFLKRETDLIQDQTDKAALADQAKQGKDRADKIKQAEEEQNKIAEAQQRGLDKRLNIEREYAKKVSEEHKKEAEEAIKMADAQFKATEEVTKAAMDQMKERARLEEELGKEEAEHSKKMAALELADENNVTKEMVKAHKSRSEQVLDAQLEGENAAYQAQMRAYQIELSSLDKFSKEYEVKEKQINDREAELTKEHENKITQIKLQAEEERNQRVLAAEKKFSDSVSSSLAKVLEGHETFGKMMIGIGNQVASGLMENAIKSVMANNFTKESDAAAAARKAYLAGMHFPFPANIVMGPTLAAMAFASVMAFEDGGVVPGVEKGDVVPARLTPGEGVLPKQTMDNLKNASSGSASNQPSQVHNHTHHYHLNAIDGPSVERMLDKHSDKFEKHVESHFRKRNM